MKKHEGEYLKRQEIKWNTKKIDLINHKKTGKKKQGNKKQMGQIENKWQDGRPKSNLLTVTLNVYELNTTIKKLIFTLH